METFCNMKELLRRNVKKGSTFKKGRSSSDEKVFDNFIKDEHFCTEVFHMMEKQERSPFDRQMILLLLSTMQSLLQLVKEVNENFLGLLYSISGVIKYEKLEANRILFKSGDEADKFYILLKGKVAVALPVEEEIGMSEEEYILYLAKLKVYQEKDLLIQCINKNQYVYPVEIDELDNFIKDYYKNYLSSMRSQDLLWEISSEEGAIDDYDENVPYSFYICTNRILKRAVELAEAHQLKLKGSLRRIEQTYTKIGLYLKVDSITEYIKRSYPIIRDKKTDRKQVTIYKYTFLRFLKSGDKFGELAFNQTSNRRTASIISVEDCHLGTLDDASFKHSLKDLYDRLRKNNISFLLSQPIFADYNRVLFEKNLFSCFTHEKGVRNQIILQEGSCSEMVYILREGEFEVFSYKSLKEIDFLITLLGGEGVADLENYGDKILKKKFIKISIIKNNELVGLSDYRYNDKIIFMMRCISNKCEYFKIEYDIFKRLLHDPTTRKNFQKILYFKKQYILHRLIDIRATQLRCLQMLSNSSINSTNTSFPTAFKSFEEGKVSQVGNKPKFLKTSFKNNFINSILKKDVSVGDIILKKPSKMINLLNYFENVMKKNTDGISEIEKKNNQPYIRSTIRNLTIVKKPQGSKEMPLRKKSNPNFIVIMESNETNNDHQILSQEERKKGIAKRNNTDQNIHLNQSLSKATETLQIKNILTLESTKRSSENSVIKNELTTTTEPLIRATCSKKFEINTLSYSKEGGKSEKKAKQSIPQNTNSSKEIVDLLSMDNFNRIYNSELYFQKIFQKKSAGHSTVDHHADIEKTADANCISTTKKSTQKLSFLESFKPESTISNLYSQRNSANSPGYQKMSKKFDFMITDNSIKKLDPFSGISELFTSNISTNFQNVQKLQSQSKRMKEFYSNVLRRNKQQLNCEL